MRDDLADRVDTPPRSGYCFDMRGKVTPSLVISVLALIVALGGASYAAIKLPRNSVGPAQLKKNSVSAGKLRKGSVNSAKVKDRSLKASDLAAGVLPGVTWYGERDVSSLLDLTGEMQVLATTTELKPGPYVVSGRANVLGGAASSTVLCSLVSDAAQNFTVAPGAVFPLAMNGVAKLTEPGTIALRCNRSSGTPQIAQAHVIATRVPQIIGAPE